jgi:uncharacterized membrane protein HdeD (DUF308 family)
MGIRILLIIAGLLALAFGALMIFAPDGMVVAFNVGDSSVAARAFARAFGSALVAIGVMDLIAARDRGSPALDAILVANLLLHLLSPALDFIEPFPKDGSYWGSFVLHALLVIAFAWALVARRRKATA